ncbi:Hexosyltransferase [Aphelenchoides fujianensis]|nr:Hexosyltransferase [Aphelenchoides fujianensis]
MQQQPSGFTAHGLVRDVYTPESLYAATPRPTTQLLIVVISEADDPAQRALIRSHWGARRHRRRSTEIVFLVGLSDGNRTDLRTEQRRFKDLVLTSVVEDYYNLSLKTAAMFLFAQAHYPAAKCVLKVDSDNVLNVSNVEDLCDSFGDDEELITGHCEDKTPVIREWSSKWRIPRFVYPAAEFPLYCFGEAYLFVGRQVPRKLLAQLDAYGFQRSANARKMPEDVIFSGLLAEKAGIERRLTDGFALQRKEARFGCLGGRPRAFSFHLVGEAENFEKAENLMSAANHFDCSHIS